MRGSYRDTLTDNGLSTTKPWRKNLVVDRCYALLAGLAKNEPALSGVLFMAVGGPPPERSAPPRPDDLGLQSEVYRQQILPASIGFIDASGAPTRVPTSRLSVRVVLRGDDLGATSAAPARLHEFGLFGGDASERPGSGFLINRVVHDPIEVSAGAILERRLELDFGAPSRSEGSTELAAPSDAAPGPFGWVLPIGAIDGVGSMHRDTLLRAGFVTVDLLAAHDPEAIVSGMERAEHSEIVSKARLIRRLQLPRSALALGDALVVDVVEADPAELAARSAGTLRVEEVRAIQQTLSLLELALDAPEFARLLVRELVAPPNLWAAPGRFGPYGADLSTDAVQGIGDQLQAVLRNAGIRTVGELIARPPARIGHLSPSVLRKLLTKARMIRRIEVPAMFATFGERSLRDLVRAQTEALASSTGGAARRGDVERLQDALRLLELSMSQPYFDATRLRSLLGGSAR